MIGKAGAGILRMALDRLDDAAPVVRNVVKEAPDAAKKALDDMAGAVDDWGWKGGKPGEVTGGELMRLKDALRSDTKSPYEQRKKAFDDAFGTFADQLKKEVASNPGGGLARNYTLLRGYVPSEAEYNVAIDFEKLERAGIPRQWTGRVLSSLYGLGLRNNREPVNLMRVGDSLRPSGRVFDSSNSVTGIADVAPQIAERLSGLTNSQRDTLLSLLPEWEGSLDDLAKVARSL